MQRIDTVEFERNPTPYVRRAGQGETLEITEGGVPVALLTPVPETGQLTPEDMAASGNYRTSNLSLETKQTPPDSVDEPPIDEMLSEMPED